MDPSKAELIELPVPRLVGGRVSLVPPDRKYWETIRAWESDPTDLHLWTHRNGVPTKEQFEDAFDYRLRNYYFAYFVVLNRHEEAVGFTYLYESRGESAFLTAFMDRSYRNSGLAIRAIARLLHWAFSFYPLERILADTFAYNQISERNLRKAGFVVNGEIQRHRRYQGHFYSLKQWELTREGFYDRHLELLKREIPQRP